MVSEPCQSQRKIVLVIIGISSYRILIDLHGATSVTKVRINVAQQSKVTIISLSADRDLLGSLERRFIKTLAEISISQVELHIVGIRIRVQRGLKMLDRFII